MKFWLAPAMTLAAISVPAKAQGLTEPVGFRSPDGRNSISLPLDESGPSRKSGVTASDKLEIDLAAMGGAVAVLRR